MLPSTWQYEDMHNIFLLFTNKSIDKITTSVNCLLIKHLYMYIVSILMFKQQSLQL